MAKKAVETRRKEPQANMKGLPEPVGEFMKDEAVMRFPEFHAAVVARSIAYLYPGGDTGEKPNFRRVQGINVLVREAARAARVAVEGVGMMAKVDTGQKTRTHGRVLEVGTVTEMVPVLSQGTHVRNRLQMTRPDGRSVTRLVRIMQVHRLDERRAG